ncbi:MAG TPA: Hpt domain-containing protein [Candidatus Didemnitutus sp.]|jgi:HPt (histidine-containing phosphotransfer) domain-containing protein
MSDAHLDPEAIANLRAVNPDDGGEFLRELIDIFLADTPERIAEIEQALGVGEAEVVSRAAHSIKGSAGNFGAVELASLARGIEQQGNARDFTAARAGLAGLRAEFARARTVLERLKQSP